LDGTATYSEIKSVSIDERADIDINIFPNPTEGIVQVQSKGLVIEEVILLDNAGKDLTAKLKQISNNEEGLILNLEQLTTGAYYLILNGEIVEKVQRK